MCMCVCVCVNGRRDLYPIAFAWLLKIFKFVSDYVKLIEFYVANAHDIYSNHCEVKG